MELACNKHAPKITTAVGRIRSLRNAIVFMEVTPRRCCRRRLLASAILLPFGIVSGVNQMIGPPPRTRAEAAVIFGILLLLPSSPLKLLIRLLPSVTLLEAVVLLPFLVIVEELTTDEQERGDLACQLARYSMTATV